MAAFTREQIRALDRRAIEDYGIPGIVLMENAGRNAAREILGWLHLPDAELPRTSETAGAPQPALDKRVLIFCGLGNNGGDGYVIARHLHNAGLNVEISTIGDTRRLAPDARINHDIAVKMGIVVETFEFEQASHKARRADVLVDALLGTGFQGALRPPYDRAVTIINETPQVQRIAIDVPSGLDCNSGVPADPTVRADLTVTFAAAKIGFECPGARAFTGRVVVVDIGAPRALLG